MRIFCLLLMIFVVFSVAPAQTREAAIETFKNLKQQPLTDPSVEPAILAPAKWDLEAATREGVNVFRILPRETYDKGIFLVRGGGAYYSFTQKSHNYNATPQISLERDKFLVSFYGANYGFITNLVNAPLVDVDLKTPAVVFLSTYQSVSQEPLAREEYRRIGAGLNVEGVTYSAYLPVTVGGTYALRAISYNEADTLVAFKVYRKDPDGSLIIFWKSLKDFDKPLLARN